MKKWLAKSASDLYISMVKSASMPGGNTGKSNLYSCIVQQ